MDPCAHCAHGLCSKPSISAFLEIAALKPEPIKSFRLLTHSFFAGHRTRGTISLGGLAATQLPLQLRKVSSSSLEPGIADASRAYLQTALPSLDEKATWVGRVSEWELGRVGYKQAFLQNP